MFAVHSAWQHELTREELQTNVSKLYSVPALPLCVLHQGILSRLLSQTPGNLNLKYLQSSETPLADSAFEKVSSFLRISKVSKSERVKLSDREPDCRVSSNPEVPPVPCKHPWIFTCRDNQRQLEVHALPQSQSSTGFLQGYSAAQ